MSIRFCATMRSPAPSMTALTAPVRFRSVASGVMMEKVRAGAMDDPFLGVLGSGALIAVPFRWLKRLLARARGARHCNNGPILYAPRDGPMGSMRREA